MGAFYNSICAQGDCTAEVERTLDRWMSLRGFRRSQQPMLFDLDSDHERCAFLLSNDRWTVLVFSNYEEERRLIRELQVILDPLLYVWVQDSDVWGYDLFRGQGIAGSFVSEAQAYQSFPDDGPVGSEKRPVASPEETCVLLGREDRVAELRKILRRSAAFEEEVCLEFCRLFGVEAAILSYDDLERGRPESLPGWRCEQILYVQRDAAPDPRPVALHELALTSLQSGIAMLAQPPQAALSPELRAEMEEMRRRADQRLRLLRPLARIAGWWGRRKGRAMPVLEGSRGSGGSDIGSTRADPDGGFGRVLRSERHSCEITLAKGATARRVSGRPAAVFAFQVGSIAVSCTARPPGKVADILRPPSRAEILRDEKLSVGRLQARALLFKLPPSYLAGSKDPSHLGLHVVQTPPALYVFLFRYSSQIDHEADRIIRTTVESFRWKP